MQIYRVEYYAHDAAPVSKYEAEYFRCPILAARRLVDLQGMGYHPSIETVDVNDSVEGK